MIEQAKTFNALLPLFDVVISVALLIGLLPVTGALPAIAMPAFPLATTFWFFVGLGGAFLLLATGPKLLLGGISLPIFIIVFALLIAAAGGVRLYSIGFKDLLVDWALMAFFVGVLLILLRHPWIWGLVGGLWGGLLLGVWSAVGIYSYVTTPTRVFSKLLLFQLFASVFAVAVAIVHLRLGYKQS